MKTILTAFAIAAVLGLTAPGAMAARKPTRKAVQLPPVPPSYSQVLVRCRQWVRVNWFPGFDIYTGSDGLLHGWATPESNYQFNKCMDLNGFSVGMIPKDGPWTY
jgi:hypothetical protein